MKSQQIKETNIRDLMVFLCGSLVQMLPTARWTVVIAEDDYNRLYTKHNLGKIPDWLTSYEIEVFHENGSGIFPIVSKTIMHY